MLFISMSVVIDVDHPPNSIYLFLALVECRKWIECDVMYFGSSFVDGMEDCVVSMVDSSIFG